MKFACPPRQNGNMRVVRERQPPLLSATKLRRTSQTIVGRETRRSEWVNWELQMALGFRICTVMSMSGARMSITPVMTAHPMMAAPGSKEQIQFSESCADVHGITPNQRAVRRAGIRTNKLPTAAPMGFAWSWFNVRNRRIEFKL